MKTWQFALIDIGRLSAGPATTPDQPGHDLPAIDEEKEQAISAKATLAVQFGAADEQALRLRGAPSGENRISYQPGRRLQ